MIKSYFFRPNKEMEAYKNKRPGQDAGYDLYAKENRWFWPLQTIKIDSNSHIHIPAEHLGRVTSRSGHSKEGWLVHPGTIDHGYTGNLGVIMTNLSFFPRRIKAGTRIAQLIFMPFTAVDLEEIDRYEDYETIVARLSRSDRGQSGFGDSGKQ